MLKNNKPSTTLPEGLKKHFWDVEFDELSFEKYPRFISERILNYGDLNAIRWLLSHTDLEFIKNLVENNRNLNAKTKNYWLTILMIPDTKIR